MATEVKTEHPHIVRVEGVRGGRPVIKGSRILVSLIATYYKMGETPDNILRLYPHLPAAAIYDALSRGVRHYAPTMTTGLRLTQSLRTRRLNG